MKRLHVHIAVQDLDKAVQFYSRLFGIGPGVLKADYARWMLDDPRVNFAVSTHGCKPGLDHLGIQAETVEELQELAGRMEAAAQPLVFQDQTVCCYARSTKRWTTDPQGIPWEAFMTTGESADFGEDSPTKHEIPPAHASVKIGSCCAPGPG